MTTAGKPPSKSKVAQRHYKQRYRQRKRVERERLTAGSLCVDDAMAWVESALTVPDGPLAGLPFRLGEWQRRFLGGALADGIRRAGLSVARKNGKSGLIAALLLSCLEGPLYRPGWRGLVVSLTGGLAKELRLQITRIAEASEIKLGKVSEYPPPGQIVHRDAQLDILASDKATGHAAGADLVVIDEAGLLEERDRELWNAVEGSTAARDGRLLAISVQGRGPMFKELQDLREDSAVYWQEHSCRADVQPDDKEAWESSNPGMLDGIKSADWMEDQCRLAMASPANLNAFLLYQLNAPVDPERLMICSPSDWAKCVVVEDALPPREGACVVGLDLGGSSSMTAAAAYWPRSGRVEAWGAFPGIPDLRTRSRADGQGEAYLEMERRSELKVYPGTRSTPVGAFLADMKERLRGARVSRIVSDRFRQSEAEDYYTAAGVTWPRRYRGLGWRDASEDVRAFQRAVLDGRLRVVESLLLANAIASSTLAVDAAGNAKVDRSTARGRIDALVAAVLAVGEGQRWLDRPKARVVRSAIA